MILIALLRIRVVPSVYNGRAAPSSTRSLQVLRRGRPRYPISQALILIMAESLASRGNLSSGRQRRAQKLINELQ